MKESITRKFAILVHADVVGSTALVQLNETIAHERIQLAFRRFSVIIQNYGGTAHEIRGDALVAEFNLASDALAASLAFQRENQEFNDSLDDAIKPSVRIGIAMGEVVVADNTITGDGIVMAQRLEQLAEPSGVCIQDAIYQTVPKRFSFEYESLGARELKGFAEAVNAYTVTVRQGASIPKPEQQVSKMDSSTGKSRRMIGIGMAAALLIAVAGYFLWNQWDMENQELEFAQQSTLPIPDIPSIAILPFENMSDDSSQEYFVDGMTEDLITDLSKLNKLFVIARNSAFAYKGKSMDARKIARELGVRYVLEGSVRRASNQVRVNAQLIDGVTGGHLWAERYDGALEDIFTLQDQITGKIVSALKVSLAGEEAPEPSLPPTRNAEAHDAFLQGWAYFNLGDINNLAKSIPHFQDAINLDPGHAKAQAAIASVYWDAFVDDWGFEIKTPSFMLESLVEEHLAEAMKYPTPLAHALQSRINFYLFDIDGAIAEAEKAVMLDQNDATSQAALANALILSGQPDKGVISIEKAMRLDPHYPPEYLVILGASQFAQGSYKDAIVTFKRAIKRNPDDEIPRIYLGSALGHAGRLDEGENVIENANELRFAMGMSAMSLEKAKVDGIGPFTGEIDFSMFGNAELRGRVREGLSRLPIMTWQYLVDYTSYSAGSETVAAVYRIQGANEIDIHMAKGLFDRGAKFVDVGFKYDWEIGHIRGAINLPSEPDKRNPEASRYKATTLEHYVDRNEEIVLYWHPHKITDSNEGNTIIAALQSAKAVSWGYTKVYFLENVGLLKWKEAGYPVTLKQTE